MPVNAIHIVSFDVPFPPSYGGVIDVYYKIKALKEMGIAVHLHCFMYGREKSNELEKICASVNYYKRQTRNNLLFSSLPYIIASRRSDELLKNLSSDNAPVLFEGLHCCAYLDAPELKAKKKFVRTHNIEHDYYRSLADVESKFAKRFYFRREAKKLERFEKKLGMADAVLAISPADAACLSARYKNVHHVMAFHPYENVMIQPGKGKFALYHGNLEVGENNLAALFLSREVFDTIDIPLVIAGNNPSEELKKLVAEKRNITLKANISTAEIDQLIADAHINVLPTFQATGIKLKLLAALFRGRFALVNSPMVANTGLESLCVTGETAPALKSQLLKLFREDFKEEEIEKRKMLLADKFSNKKNAEKIVRLIQS
ncbi:MAG: glycosyltransferase [Bacteroidota bacterium]|nr:glycosyltransferase [Bacteroidota bacterium]